MRILALALALLPASTLAQTPDASCARLTTLSLDHARVTSASILPAATAIPGVDLPAPRVAALPAFCRVQITATPTPDSDIKTEIWLPLATGDHPWNGRYYGQGNGGFAGQIYFDQMAAALTSGYITSGTDTGHPNTTGDFALHHPEKVIDFGWRAIHLTALQSKALASAFYGKPPAHSYFAACSDGGREALMEAQRFPADYDGILAGAPAYNWTALLASSTADQQALSSSPAAYISSRKLPAIAAAVLAACDKNDGLQDGILTDPRTCHFAPETLACSSAETDACLTPPQVATLKTIYAAKSGPAGKYLYPGYLPGAEDPRGSWDTWQFGSAPGAMTLMLFFGQGFYSNFVHQDPSWTVARFDFAKDLALSISTSAQALNATDPNLKPFFERGGKLILYHGWNDPAIPAIGTIDYFNALTATVGAKTAHDSTRLYMVPGMLHCGGGPGATDFGQNAAIPRTDPTHDVFTALEQWVEAGHAPDRLTATRYTSGDPTKPVLLTRPLCPYLQQPTYTATKDPTQAASFTCTK